MDNISYDILSGEHYFMEDTILCYTFTETINHFGGFIIQAI